MTDQRAQFGTRLGVIATTVGSAVGLGNIWRFPYEAGAHGGGAFLLIYIGFIFLIGVPVICAEFIMGRGTRRNIFGAFRALHSSRYWAWTGYMGILASILILSFYSVVAGWTMEYLAEALTGTLDAASAGGELHDAFDNFAAGPRSVMWTLIFLAINAVILFRGVRGGIERASNVLMPVLFIILIIFCINSLTMPEAAEGLRFLFRPDFTKVDSSMLIGALGQAFFSLSLGLGTLMTYSSYFSDSTPLVKSAVTTASLDTLVAILAGIIIFPAVFTYGCEPAAGPKLVFEVLPSIFHQMPGGPIWAILFFFLLFLASLTSTISMSEICIAFFCEQLGMSRRRATLLNTVIAMSLGTLCALSFGAFSGFTVCGLTIFNLFDYLSSNIMLPLGGMLISIFAGWIVDRRILRSQLAGTGRISTPLLRTITFCLRYVAPAAILLVFLSGLDII
ncbi:sodium-dependent transporter [uncultured Muribaculum sp.]|uniref:sodium-dependent transporter n=1 Tax=uncultured Muribaculum sp. TaxID=1918613 RepID=UPI0025E6F2D6|nr:sodium-dependent transporter [uncultured Muribaculum sp.]